MMPLHIDLEWDQHDLNTDSADIKSEEECLSIVTSFEDLKEEAGDSSPRNGTHRNSQANSLEEHLNIPKSKEVQEAALSCTFCMFKTSRAIEMDGHLHYIHKIGCKDCLDVGFKRCKVHRIPKSKTVSKSNSQTMSKSRKAKSKKITVYTPNSSKKNVTSDLQLQCEECSFIATSIFRLRKHATIHQHKKLHNCSNCNFQTTVLCDLEQHLRSHAIEEPFRCTLCVFETPWKRDLEQHLNMHFGPPVPINCPKCYFKTFNANEFESHKTEHRARKRKCYFCSFVDTSKNRFPNHIKIHLMKCFLCSFETFQKWHLKEHMACHKGQYPFVLRCNICLYETTRELIFEMHLSEHNKAMELHCKQCSFKTPDVSLLDCHMKVHAKSAYRNNSKLKRGFDRVTKQKILKCVQCGYKTNIKRLIQKHYFKAHIMSRVMTSKRPFVCPKCDFSTQLKYIYNCHKRLHS